MFCAFDWLIALAGTNSAFGSVLNHSQEGFSLPEKQFLPALILRRHAG
jgi:hypothetical protein